jgi:hypothetical protein
LTRIVFNDLEIELKLACVAKTFGLGLTLRGTSMKVNIGLYVNGR